MMATGLKLSRMARLAAQHSAMNAHACLTLICPAGIGHLFSCRDRAARGARSHLMRGGYTGALGGQTGTSVIAV